ncbi:hypothetical protein GTA51_20115 [Desulfovibrio aerotolerans]|uniref:Uncharacterized protein n=1 Tax=Solidesulfovibrio aerotolerans TaxID=295255 RepID=A0A7C9MNH3_9BACT|nr:hypothetical protein [Solidesulfovibrio aerotolerans]MYL85393.1 hypothetical protein [Solidesulfovibrio aerotolerans]
MRNLKISSVCRMASGLSLFSPAGWQGAHIAKQCISAPFGILAPLTFGYRFHKTMSTGYQPKTKKRRKTKAKSQNYFSINEALTAGETKEFNKSRDYLKPREI